MQRDRRLTARENPWKPCDYCGKLVLKSPNRDGDLLCDDCQQERDRKDSISHPSPCCGLQTEWVDSYHRRCPCGRKHRF